MKLLERLRNLSIILAGGLIYSSCLNSDEPEGFYSTLGTVTEIGHNLTFESDSYGLLKPTNPNWFLAEEADSVGQRVLAGVQFYEGEQRIRDENPVEVQIVRLYKVLTKKVDDIRSGEADIYGDDPVQIVAVSVTREHLNIQFTLGSSGSGIPHRISLVLTEESVPDEEGILPVEFRHNSGEDISAGDGRGWGIASYTLKSIDEKFSDAEIKGFKILYNDGRNSHAQCIVRRESENRMVLQPLNDSLLMHSF